jgi:hypothetical protein
MTPSSTLSTGVARLWFALVFGCRHDRRLAFRVLDETGRGDVRANRFVYE